MYVEKKLSYVTTLWRSGDNIIVVWKILIPQYEQ